MFSDVFLIFQEKLSCKHHFWRIGKLLMLTVA